MTEDLLLYRAVINTEIEMPKGVYKRTKERSQQWKDRQRIAHLGNQNSKGKNLGNQNAKGMHHTEEWKKTMSLRLKGKPSYAKGSHRSEEWKQSHRKNNITPRSGRVRAERMYPSCPEGKERHHIDGNPLNNDPSNIEFLTHKEHMKKHRKMERT